MKFTQDDIKNLGTIVGIWAHPDDETCWSGGLMAAARANDQRVVIITATRGDGGETADESRWPKSKLGEIREKELRTALTVIGVEELRLLDYQDGELYSVDETAAVQRISEILQEVGAKTVITFEEQGITGHDDHKTIRNWALRAAKQTGDLVVFCAYETAERYGETGKACDEEFSLYFKTDNPQLLTESDADLWFELPKELQAKKFKSICAHECQYSKLLSSLKGSAWLESLCNHEAFKKA